jgi:hypothetical protein
MLTWGVVAGIHFSAAILILPLTTALVGQASASPEGGGAAIDLLIRLTRLLHFPLVTLALYPREWFPGNWVYLPMAANSALWAAVVVGLIGWYRKVR